MSTRRDLITLLGGAAAWPLVARAQQAERVRRVGVLMDTAENNTEGQARLAAFRQVLRDRGWVEGRNIQIAVRWPVGDLVRAQAYAKELVTFGPDAIFAIANAQIRPLSLETRTIPIIFLGASDPRRRHRKGHRGTRPTPK